MSTSLEAVTVRHLRYLAVVADQISFTDAADVLGVTQSALSQAMRRLETLAGAPLFTADGRSRRLTDIGRALAERAAEVVGLVEGIGEEIEGLASGSAGRLRVGMIDAAAIYLVPDAVTAIKRDNPEVDIDVAVDGSASLIDRVARHDLDVAVVIAPVAARLDVVPVVDEPLHIYRGGADMDCPWVLYPRSSHTRAAIDLALARRGIAPDVIAESSNPAVLARLALLDGAATVLPEAVAEPGLEFVSELTTRQVVAVHRHGDPAPLVVRFLEQVTTLG